MIFEKDKVLAQTSVSVDGEWVAVAEQVLSRETSDYRGNDYKNR